MCQPLASASSICCLLNKKLGSQWTQGYLVIPVMPKNLVGALQFSWLSPHGCKMSTVPLGTMCSHVRREGFSFYFGEQFQGLQNNSYFALIEQSWVICLYLDAKEPGIVSSGINIKRVSWLIHIFGLTCKTTFLKVKVV